MAELRREPVTGMWVVVTNDDPKGPADYLSFKPPFRPPGYGGALSLLSGQRRDDPPRDFFVETGGRRKMVRSGDSE